MNVYIACGLTHVPRAAFSDYVGTINGLASSLAASLGVSVKYALRDSDPQLATKPFHERATICYLWDRAMVEWADVVVAEATFPSTGMGIELQIAEQNDIPIIVCFKSSGEHQATPVSYLTPDGEVHSLQIGEGFVSLMALGLPSIFRVVSYSNDEQLFQKIGQAVEILSAPD